MARPHRMISDQATCGSSPKDMVMPCNAWVPMRLILFSALMMDISANLEPSRLQTGLGTLHQMSLLKICDYLSRLSLISRKARHISYRDKYRRHGRSFCGKSTSQLTNSLINPV